MKNLQLSSGVLPLLLAWILLPVPLLASGHEPAREAARLLPHPPQAQDTATPTPSATLDQQQPIYTGGLSVRSSATQTVVMGGAGLLVRIDLALCSPSKNSDIELTAVDTTANGPSATASLKFKASYSDCAWYELDLSQPISVAAGDTVLLTARTKNHKAVLWGFDGQGGDPYPPGVGTWRGQTINDFAFRTYLG